MHGTALGVVDADKDAEFRAEYLVGFMDQRALKFSVLQRPHRGPRYRHERELEGGAGIDDDGIDD